MRLDAVVFSNVRWHQPRLFSICFWPPSCSIRCIRMSQLTEKGGTSGKQLFPLAGRRHEEEEEIGPRRDGGTLLFTCPVCHSWRTSSPSRHTRTECPNQQVLSSSSFFSYPDPSEINKWWRCYRFLLLMSLLFNNSTPFFSFPVKWCIVAASSPCVATGLPWRHTQLQ